MNADQCSHTAAAAGANSRIKSSPCWNEASTSVRETPEFLSNAVQQLDQAVNLLPLEETAAYRTALQKCPQLIAREAHPVSFLRCCSWNPWDAAARWMEYWKLRFKTFGPERCYRSLDDLSGNGALDEVCIRIVESGLFYLLKNDTFGRPVMLFDRSKFSPRLQKKWNVTVEDKLRVVFYGLHIMALQQPQASKNSALIVHLVTAKDPKSYPSVNQFASKATKDCFPFHLHAFHVVIAPNLEKRKRFAFESKVVSFIRLMAQRAFYFSNTNFHLVWVDETSKYQTELAKVLMEKINIVPEALPPVAGGNWSHARYKRWFVAQQQEQVAATARLPGLPTTTTTASSTALFTANDGASVADTKPSSLNLLAMAAEGAMDSDDPEGSRKRNCDQQDVPDESLQSSAKVQRTIGHPRPK